MRTSQGSSIVTLELDSQDDLSGDLLGMVARSFTVVDEGCAVM